MADADTTAYNIVPPSSFAYNPARINVGSIGYYTGIENVIVSSLYEVFQTADYVDDRFMWHWFKSDHFSKWIERLQEGSVRLYFYYDKLIQCEMKMPSLEEQKKMGAFFDQLDHLITLHQRKNIYFYEKVTLVWEQRKLGEIAFSFEYGLNAAAKEYDGENKYIRITDIDNNTHEFLTYNLTSPDIDLTDAENYKLAEGDILLARTGASVGKSYIYRDSDGLVYYAGFLIRARIREEYDAEFVFQSTLTDKYNKYIAVTSQRSGQPGMNAQEYSEFEIRVPEKEEQTKIGTYFRILDHLITLHQCKCHLLHKLLHNDWEQRKLEDIMDTVTDYVAAGSFEDIRNNVTYLNEPGYAQLVRTVDLKKKFTNNDSIYVDESAFKYLWRVNLNEECIVLPNIGANIGEVYFVEPSGLPYDNNVLGPNAILLKANEDTYFAFTALNNLTFQKQLFENVGSSGQPKFNKTELKSIQLYMPQNEEQEKIGQYFRDLDHLITLHHRKYIYILKSP